MNFNKKCTSDLINVISVFQSVSLINMEGSRTFFDYLLEEDNFKLCFMLAKATSGMKTVPLDNLRLLFEMSPVVDGDFCLLDTRSLSALIALSLALVESGFQNKESITRLEIVHFSFL